MAQGDRESERLVEWCTGGLVGRGSGHDLPHGQTATEHNGNSFEPDIPVDTKRWAPCIHFAIQTEAHKSGRAPPRAYKSPTSALFIGNQRISKEMLLSVIFNERQPLLRTPCPPIPIRIPSHAMEIILKRREMFTNFEISELQPGHATCWASNVRQCLTDEMK